MTPETACVRPGADGACDGAPAAARTRTKAAAPAPSETRAIALVGLASLLLVFAPGPLLAQTNASCGDDVSEVCGAPADTNPALS